MFSTNDVILVTLSLLFLLNTVPSVGLGNDPLPKELLWRLQQLAGVDGMEGYDLSILVYPCLPDSKPPLSPARFAGLNLYSPHKQPSLCIPFSVSLLGTSCRYFTDHHTNAHRRAKAVKAYCGSMAHAEVHSEVSFRHILGQSVPQL